MANLFIFLSNWKGTLIKAEIHKEEKLIHFRTTNLNVAPINGINNTT